MNIKIIIAAHKPYPMPEDAVYLPLHVGAEGKEPIGFVTDNTGDNISHKNSAYCELTGLYWAWKNLDCDYLGLAHYRRHFASSNKNMAFRNIGDKSDGTDSAFKDANQSELACGFLSVKEYEKVCTKLSRVLTGTETENLFDHADILVPKKRNYYIETLYSHYAHTHDASHLDKAGEIIKGKYPAYEQAFHKVIHSRGGYMFNMFIMSREHVQDYCSWLFDILGELERQVDASQLSAFQGRLYGRVSEILFNVWLQVKQEQGAVVKEIPYMHMEDVNWWKKGTAFLKAKFAGKKYEGSF